MDEKVECGHPHLTKVINPEYGGTASKTYRCDRCGDLFMVTITPFEIKVKFPTERGE